MSSSSPLVLALDTATQICSVALARDGSVAAFREDNSGNGHSERILVMADEVLKDAGIVLKDLDAVAFGAGPGAFTGLRIACGVAQGLAWGAEKPAVPVGNLEALAFRVLKEENPGARVLAAVDARMRQAYCAVYEKREGDALPLEIIAPQLANPEDLARIAKESCASIAAGSAFKVFPAALDSEGMRLFPDERAEARSIALLGELLFRAGKAVPAGQAAPLYVRNRVALTIREREARERL